MRNGLSQSTYDQIITYFLGQSSVYTDSMNLSEWHIYGSSRLGIYQTSINMAYRNIRIVNSVTTQETTTTVTLPSYTLFDIQRGAKRYELTNHLGNVLAVVSDKKISNCPTEIANFNFSTTPNLNGAWNVKNSFQGQNATISVVSQKLHIDDNQTSDPYARVNYFMPSDLIKNHLYKVEIDIAKLNNKGSGIWMLDVDYNANMNAYGGTMVRYNLAEGTNIINFTAPGFIWRFRFIYSIPQEDIEYTFDNFKITDITTGETINYIADVVSATDYSPFGAPLAERTYTALNISYRFAFNGKELDPEGMGGGGSTYDYGFRIYNAQLGKFLSVDPLISEYPMLSSYQYASNTPIVCIDWDGQEGLWYLKAKSGIYGPTVAKIVNGTEDGVQASVTKSWKFLTKDAWKSETWKQAGLFLEETALSSSPFAGIYNPNTPRLDALVANFEKNVINGDAYSRSRYLSEFGTDLLTSYIGSKGLGTFKSFAANTVKTPWSIAKQSLTIKALKGAVDAKKGATLYRIGTTGKSAQGAAAQFWSLENPLLDPEAYAKKYNVPLENIKKADFIETAVLKKDANFVTREAGSAPGSANTGKGIEIVVEQGGTTGNRITPIN